MAFSLKHESSTYRSHTSRVAMGYSQDHHFFKYKYLIPETYWSWYCKDFSKCAVKAVSTIQQRRNKFEKQRRWRTTYQTQLPTPVFLVPCMWTSPQKTPSACRCRLSNRQNLIGTVSVSVPKHSIATGKFPSRHAKILDKHSRKTEK